MADRSRQDDGHRSSRRDDSEWQQWPEKTLHGARAGTPVENVWEQWPAVRAHARNGSPQPGDGEAHTRSSVEDEWEQWPEETTHLHLSTAQLGEEIWEELPEDAIREPLPSGEEIWEELPEDAMREPLPWEEAVNQSLNASLHPALRSNFKIKETWDRAPEMVSPMMTRANPQAAAFLPLSGKITDVDPEAGSRSREQTWDRAPEMVSPIMTGANPQAAAFLPLSGELADVDSRDQTAHGKRRRHRSRVPSPELNSRHHHTRRHHKATPDDVELHSPLEEEPRHRHRRHRRHVSRSAEDETDSGDMVGERHTRDVTPMRRKHHRSERRRLRTPDHKADAGDVIVEANPEAGSRSRHVHFRSNEDQATDDHGEGRLRHGKSSHRPSRSRSRTTASHHDREHSRGGTVQEDDEATTGHCRHHRHPDRRMTRA